MTTTGLVELEAGTSIKLGQNTHLQPANNGNKFWAHINFPSNCNNVYNFNCRYINGGDSSTYNSDGFMFDENFYYSYFNRFQVKDSLIHPQNLTVYPNPTSGEINIKSADGSNILSVQIFNTLGLTILKKYFNSSNNSQVAINITGNKEGLYYLLINIEGTMISKKVILTYR